MNVPLIEKPDATSLTIRRVFEVDAATLWEALTNPEIWLHWFGGGYTTPKAASADLRVGGDWRIELVGNETGNISVLAGAFEEIEPRSRLVFSWRWEGAPERGDSRVSYRLLPGEAGGQTVLILHHERLPDPDMRDNHITGWSGSLDKLAARFAAEGGA